jgi:hypothetical protein
MPILKKIAQCQHLRCNGTRCGSPALKEKPLCFFHNRLLNAPEREIAHSVEDANSIQVALGEVVNRLFNCRIDVKKAKAMIYALQVAASNLKKTDLVPHPKKMATYDPAYEPNHALNEVIRQKAERDKELGEQRRAQNA